MKKIFFSLLVLAAGLTAGAQVTLSPVGFTAIDEVTIEIDATGTGMAGETEAYIWIFSNPDIPANQQSTYPGRDGVVNGQWGNSSEAARVTRISGNRWRFKFIATDMFGQTPAQLKQFGFLLKSKTGNKQTPDYKPFVFEPLIFVATTFRTFPQKVGITDVATINFDQSLATAVNDQRMTPTSATVVLYNDAVPAQAVGTINNVPVRKNGTIYSATFYPQQATITLPAGTALRSFKYKFNGTVLDVNGAPQTVSTAETEVIFSNLK